MTSFTYRTARKNRLLGFIIAVLVIAIIGLLAGMLRITTTYVPHCEVPDQAQMSGTCCWVEL